MAYSISNIIFQITGIHAIFNRNILNLPQVWAYLNFVLPQYAIALTKPHQFILFKKLPYIYSIKVQHNTLLLEIKPLITNIKYCNTAYTQILITSTLNPYQIV